MESYILVIGEEVVDSGQKARLLIKYNEQLKVYKKNGERNSQEPAIYKLDKSPNLKKD